MKKLLVSMAAAVAALAANVSLRPAPGGSIIAVVDGNDIRPNAGGPRLLYVDGSNIRPAPGAAPILYVDGSDVRKNPGGPRLAFWDGRTLRRTPGGKILLVVDGSDIRPQAGGARLAYLDGGAPGTAHLTALLFQWRASLFQPSAAELKAAEDAIKEGQAWDAAQGNPANEAGSYKPMGGGGPWKAKTLEVKWTGGYYAMKTDAGVTLIGRKYEDSGWRVVGAIGKGAYRAGIFQNKNGAYAGSWLTEPGQPAAAQTRETWQLPGKNTIDAPIVSASTGKLTFVDTKKSLNGQGHIYAVTSDKGQKGYAYTFGNDAVGHGMVIVLGAEVGVYDFQTDGAMLNGDYFAGPSNTGFFMVTK